jgi:hypothetical protein
MPDNKTVRYTRGNIDNMELDKDSDRLSERKLEIDRLASMKQRLLLDTEKNDRIQRFSSLIAMFFSTIAIGVGATVLYSSLVDVKKTLSRSEIVERIELSEAQLKNHNVVLEGFGIKIRAVSAQIERLSDIPEGSEWKTEVSTLSQQQSTISRKLAALENALTLDPAKALAIPILRKDLESAEENLQAELKQTQQEIDRIYDQNKWFLGLMLTMALSVFGIAVSSFLSRKEP